jgi:hypothetical protein
MGVFGIAPLFIIGTYVARGPYQYFGPIMEAVVWSIGCCVLAIILGAVCFAYDAGRQSTQDVEATRKEDTR